MQSLIDLLLKYFPGQSGLIDLLKYLPDGIDTVRQMSAFVQRLIVYLKQAEPLTPEKESELDADIESLSYEPWWKPDAE